MFLYENVPSLPFLLLVKMKWVLHKLFSKSVRKLETGTELEDL